ncbi:MAG: hypothetical protein KJ077_10060 [Anaerolineae bacterium]|nr:hypothetical protein [Anaerolineae bacterium]
MSTNPKRILVIYYNPYSLDHTRLTIIQHLRTLEASDVKHDITYYNAFDDYPSGQLGEESLAAPPWVHETTFDAVILHYSFLAFHWDAMALYRWKRLFSWIGELDGLKIAIPQDEGDHAGLLDEWLFEWGVSVIFSVHYTPEGPLYPLMRNYAAIYPCLPGYIDETIAKQYAERLLPLAERAKDIVYRARELPFWFGSAGRVKSLVAEIVAPRAEALGFNVDISTRPEDAILGQAWTDFIASGKAVIGTQGGYSVIDWRGEVKAQVRAILKANPGLNFDEVAARMPPGWDDYRLLTVTPRHFEAVIAKTGQLLIEGYYKGVLEADRHYIPLKPDFSNVDEALEKLRDSQFVQNMVECAYEEIYLSDRYTYRAFAKQIEQAICNYQSLPQALERPGELMQTSEKVIAALERQLAAERHNYALQEAKLLEARQYIGELTGQLEVRVNELQHYIQLHFDDLQAHLESHAQIQEDLQQQIKTQLQISRKEAIIFAVLLALGSAVISAGLMLVIMFSLRY